MSCACPPACDPPCFTAPENFGLAFPSLVGPIGPPGGPGTFVENFDALRALDATVFTQGYIAWVSGYDATNDGGGGNFAYFPASVAADNDGTILAPANGTGRWLRVFSGAANVQWFGAIPAGAATDVTTNFQNALNTGLNIYVPGTSTYYNISSTLNLFVPGQKVYGDGRLSKIIQTGTNANSTVFLATSLGYNWFSGIYALPNPTTNSTTLGYGFTLDRCDNSGVQNCFVSGHRRGGVLILVSSYCKVLANDIRDSIIQTTPPVDSTGTGYDVAIAGASSYNLVEGNHCIRGCGVGIAAFTITSGDVCNHNVIRNNVIFDQDLYGIMVYKLNAADTIDHNVVCGNKIHTVTGDIPAASLAYDYGAGIYVQTANHTHVSNNEIKNTNVHVNSVQQAPAAIGLSNSSGCVVSDNLIEDANYHGIFCIYGAAFASPVGRGVVIVGNSILNSVQAGISIQDYPSATIGDNRIYGRGAAGARGAFGIRVLQTSFTQTTDIEIVGGRIDHCDQGIQCFGTVDQITVTGVTIRDCNVYNMYLSATKVTVTTNNIIGTAASTGIFFAAACIGVCKANYVEAATTGIIQAAGSAVLVEADNIVVSSIPYQTDAGNTIYRLLSNVVNPTAKNARWVIRSNATNVTNLDDGSEGQVVTIKANAAFSVVDGAGFILAGSADFVMAVSDTLTVMKDGTAWRELSRSDNS